jgi:DNA-binding MarR family transcriptional regulator
MANEHDKQRNLGGLNHEAMQTLLGYNLAQASVTTDIVYKRHLGGPLGLRPVDFTILVLIGSNVNVTLKKLADALGIAVPNLTVIIERSVRRKLIVRVQSDEDRRSRYLRLTASGKAQLEKAWSIARGMESELLRHFSPAEWAMLLELLGRVALLRISPSIASPHG